MKYPNSNKTYVQQSSRNTAHRGMSFENDINQSNLFYLKEDRAVVHKKPTPVTIAKVDYPRRSAAKIVEAYFKLPSTTDYNGIYKSRYIDFEAKECHSKNSFPFSSIHPHQIEHLRSIIRHGGIAFILLRMNVYATDYLIKAEDFLEFYDAGTRKSLPYKWIEENAHPIPYHLQAPVDYLSVIDDLYDLRSIAYDQKTGNAHQTKNPSPQAQE